MKLRKSSGMQQCDLKDLLYPVKIIDNPMPANSENCKLVIGQLNGSSMFRERTAKRYTALILMKATAKQLYQLQSMNQ